MIIQKAVKRAIEVFEQKMTGFANNTDTRELTADLALEFSSVLKDAFSEAGQRAYQTFIESYDLQEPTMDIPRIDEVSSPQRRDISTTGQTRTFTEMGNSGKGIFSGGVPNRCFTRSLSRRLRRSIRQRRTVISTISIRRRQIRS